MTRASPARPISSRSRSTAPEVVVIGVGNCLRGDDAAGIAVARLVGAAAPAGVEVLESDGEPAGLVDAWQGARTAFVIDAVSSGAAPGSLRWFDASTSPLPVALGSSSTHGLGIADAVELGRALSRLPERIVVFCIEGDDFSWHEGISPAVARALPAAADAVLGELGATSA